MIATYVGYMMIRGAGLVMGGGGGRDHSTLGMLQGLPLPPEVRSDILLDMVPLHSLSLHFN